ncbi:VOC family protein [Pollutimonas sp. H1-120]|uniref:VOC family protein n=1 Tax=Pollutimonas sp. H1-120 TaxID=3148824 RepID=UPI003B5299F9
MSSTNESAGLAGVSVHSIDRFALTVPDLKAAVRFYTAFGLDVSDEGGKLIIKAADGHAWGVVEQGQRKALKYLSFNCFEADLPLFRKQLKTAGARDAEPLDLTGSTDYWFYDPDGNLLHLQVGPKTSPDAKTPNPRVNIAANERGAPRRGDAAQVRPRRLSHVLLFSSDVSRSIDFYCQGLGLRLSDRSQDIVAFLHAPHGCDHHLVAFAKSSVRGWHHSSWDVDGVDEVGLGAEQMAIAGYTEGWGTGRHVLGSNYFHYVRDPWGSFAEYSAHIDYIEAGYQWAGRDHPPENSLYLWGPQVPSYFIENSEAKP